MALLAAACATDPKTIEYSGFGFRGGLTGDVTLDLGPPLNLRTFTDQDMGLDEEAGEGGRLQVGTLEGFVIDGFEMKQQGTPGAIPGFDSVVGDLDLRVGRILWRKPLAGDTGIGLGLQTGLVPVDFDLSVTFTPEGASEETIAVDFLAPIPMAGFVLVGATPVSERTGASLVSFEASAMASGGSYDGASGTFWDAEARVMFRPWTPFALWVGWRQTHLDADIDSLGVFFDGDFDIEGVVFGLSLTF